MIYNNDKKVALAGDITTIEKEIAGVILAYIGKRTDEKNKVVLKSIIDRVNKKIKGAKNGKK